MTRFFPHDTVEHGGNWTRAYRIQCNRCQTTEKTPMNTSQSGGGDDSAIIARRVQDRFEASGWLIGKREQDDRCPKCKGPKPQPLDDNAFLKPKATLALVGSAATAVSAALDAHATTRDVHADAAPPAKPNGGPRVLTKEDRRIIFAKLQDVYDNETTGYTASWTDARVARDLKVPREWVEKIREENFGTFADNPEMRAVIAEAKQLFEDVKTVRADVQRVVASIATLTAEAKKYEADIMRLAQRIPTMEKKLAEFGKH